MFDSGHLFEWLLQSSKALLLARTDTLPSSEGTIGPPILISHPMMGCDNRISRQLSIPNSTLFIKEHASTRTRRDEYIE
jgi:hypothetical protein